MKNRAFLHFENDDFFAGTINLELSDQRIKNGIWGEAAFTTGMSGYQETITDPSFLGQHIIFTTSHVGNYSPNINSMQSKKSYATSIIARNFSENSFLNDLDIPLFTLDDTRALTHFLTNTDTNHKSVITSSAKTPTSEEFKSNKLICSDLFRVGQHGENSGETSWITPGDRPIALINYGVKNSIVNYLKELGYPLILLPHDSDYRTINSYSPRLVFLSSGPGDPRNYLEQIAVVKKLLNNNIPLRGICLGHQLIGSALGAKIIRLPFGQRGVNHPVIDLITDKVLITSQNHGYAIDEESFNKISNNNPLDKELFIQYKSLFDQSIEGISSTDSSIKSVQFHPEGNPGPHDALTFFSEIKNYLNSIEKSRNVSNKIEVSKLHQNTKLVNKTKIKPIPYKKILVIGMGPIKIGQASEFDYSGTQALKALQEIGADVVLLNSNPATIMTDPKMSSRTYVEPITKDTIKKIIKLEGVDSILSTMGGQTALNLCLELEEENFLTNNNVILLGANTRTITLTENRDLFSIELDKLGYQTGKRFKAPNFEEAILLANSKVGFPLIIRKDYALGGQGAALAYSVDDLRNVLSSSNGITYPITMEKSLIGFKEIELEVMVDQEQNGVVICSIENIDPCGIHTGDSITVAPAQTISDQLYQQLRTISLNIAKHMGVVAGGANVQFAINPHDESDIIVIEMNPRVSRSSALASKATGYPIAKISALLAVGYTLKEILNDITKVSPVAFEPTLDYVAIKIPIFPFNKFPSSSKILGPQMRSVGEVLALGGSFNEAFMKALRSLEMGLEIPLLDQLKSSPLKIDKEYITKRLQSPNELSLITAWEALRIGITIEKIQELTGITTWFIKQIELLYKNELSLKSSPELIKVPNILSLFKKEGFSDKYLAFLTNLPQRDIISFRREHNITPSYKAVDTCSGEFNAITPYFYSTYNAKNEATSLTESGDKTIITLGSGPNRIGQGIEFDYSCVKSCQRVRQKGMKAIMVNSNPETVSTDYESSDRLYLSPLYSEDLFDIFNNENPTGIIASFSGQTGIKIREYLENGVLSEFKQFNFLGPSLETIQLTEDRKLFGKIVKETDLEQTNTIEVVGQKKMIGAIVEIGLPVIVRPSYVIGGESMYIFNSGDDINELPEELLKQLKFTTTSFQVETYLENAIEYDVDLIMDKFGNIVFSVCEHIEYAGVHSGDSGMITPPVRMTDSIYNKMKEISTNMATVLKVIGPINFQYAVKNEKIYCIEANPRGSRTIPFLSKAHSLDMAAIATDAMLGEKIINWDKEYSNYYSVKQSTFPFDRFLKDDSILGPKMRSTGETFGMDRDKDHAVIKSYLGNYPKITEVGKILVSLLDINKPVLLPYLKSLHKKGYEFYATRGSANFIKKQGVPCQQVAKLNRENSDGIDVISILQEGNFKMIFNTPLNKNCSKANGEHIRNCATTYGIPCFTREENIRAVIEALLGLDDTISPIALQDTTTAN